MARTVWDDVAETPASDDARTSVRPGPGPERRAPRGGLLPWLLAALASAGAISLGVQRTEERRAARAEVAAARDEAAELRRRLFVTEDRLLAAERQRAAATADATTLKENAAARDELISALRAQLDAKDGDVSQEKDRISVNLVDQILFKSGDASLSPRGKEVLSKVGQVLKQLEDKQILIGGHTDDRPIHTEQFPSNWELSAARAVNVARYLQETAGVDPHKLAAAAHGEFHPRSKKDKAKNRRIEILLTPLVEIKPEKEGR